MSSRVASPRPSSAATLPEVAESIIDDAPGAAARLGIYANHFLVTLIDALTATFPVIRQLVGDSFFQAVARRYVRATPPTRPCLFMYGGGFPTFLQQLPEAQSFAYLADVARLGWAINAAWHASDSSEVDADIAAGMIAERGSNLIVCLHPSCRLVASPFPVDRIWQAHQSSCEDMGTVSLNAGGVRLLVHRQADEVGWINIREADFVCLGSLIIKGSLRKALALALAVDGDFDPTPLLAALIEGGLVSSITPVA